MYGVNRRWLYRINRRWLYGVNRRWLKWADQIACDREMRTDFWSGNLKERYILEK